jgi:hypothetical protein
VTNDSAGLVQNSNDGITRAKTIQQHKNKKKINNTVIFDNELC